MRVSLCTIGAYLTYQQYILWIYVSIWYNEQAFCFNDFMGRLYKAGRAAYTVYTPTADALVKYYKNQTKK